MHKPKTTRLRWDRIGAVAGVLALASWGIAAVVPESGSNEEMETEGRVSVMNAPVEVEVTSVELAPVAPVRPEVSVPEVQESLVKPAPSGPLPRNGIAPCSCSKYTMKLARNPYTQHQKRPEPCRGVSISNRRRPWRPEPSAVISSGFLRSAAAIICLGFHTASRSCSLPPRRCWRTWATALPMPWRARRTKAPQSGSPA